MEKKKEKTSLSAFFSPVLLRPNTLPVQAEVLLLKITRLPTCCWLCWTGRVWTLGFGCWSIAVLFCSKVTLEWNLRSRSQNSTIESPQSLQPSKYFCKFISISKVNTTRSACPGAEQIIEVFLKLHFKKYLVSLVLSINKDKPLTQQFLATGQGATLLLF